MSKKPNDSLNYAIAGFLLLSGIAVLYKFYTLTSYRQGETGIGIPLPKVIRDSGLLEKNQVVEPKLENAPKKVRNMPKNYEPLKMTHDKKRRRMTLVTKRRFTTVSRIKANFPEDMDFVPIDIEDGMASIYGYNQHTGTGLTAVAREGTTTTQEVKQYIKEFPQALPNLNGKKIKSIGITRKDSKAKRIEGVDSIELTQGELSSGERIAFAVVNRKDEKGSYIFVYSGPKSQIDNNEGYLDEIYRTLRVLPADKKKQ